MYFSLYIPQGLKKSFNSRSFNNLSLVPKMSVKRYSSKISRESDSSVELSRPQCYEHGKWKELYKTFIIKYQFKWRNFLQGGFKAPLWETFSISKNYFYFTDFAKQ